MYRMRHIVLFLFSFCLLSAAAAQEGNSVVQGFSGGMMVHAGYLSGTNGNAPVGFQGVSSGMGGALRVNVGRFFRVGMEGYVSTLGSGCSDAKEFLSAGSYIRTGQGGLLVELCRREGRWWPFVGVSLGGGAMKGLYIVEGDQSDWEAEGCVVYNRQPFVYVAPSVGTDYCVTPKIHLTIRADWSMALHDGTLIRPTGARMFVGVMFCH